MCMSLVRTVYNYIMCMNTHTLTNTHTTQTLFFKNKLFCKI